MRVDFINQYSYNKKKILILDIQSIRKSLSNMQNMKNNQSLMVITLVMY